jgi:hypothetical protein
MDTTNDAVLAALYPSMANGGNDTPSYIGAEEDGTTATRTQPKASQDRPNGLSQKEQRSPADLEQTKAAVTNAVKAMGIDPGELTEGVAEFVKDSGLSTEKLENLVELHNKQITHMADMQAKQWRDEAVKSIPQADLATAKSVVDRYANDEVKTLLSGHIGNHPALIKFLADIGKRTVTRQR